MTVEMDAMLLDMVNRQSAEIHANDTVDTLTYAQLMRLDSIERELHEIDSLRTVNAGLVLQRMDSTPHIVIEKSWIKDAEEDRNDVLRAIRDMHSPWRRELLLIKELIG